MARLSARLWIGTSLFLVALLATEAFLFLLFANDRGARGGVLEELPVVGILLAVLLTLIAVVLLVFIILWFKRDAETDDAEDGDQPFFIPDEEHYQHLQDWDEEVPGTTVEFEEAHGVMGADSNAAMTYDAEPVGEPVTDPSGSSAVTTTTTTTTTTTYEEPAWIPTDGHHIGGGMATYELKAMPIARKSWGKTQQTNEGPVHPFFFPRAVDQGIYVNDYVEIGGAARLKLRTLLAGSADIGVDIKRPAPAAKPAAAPATTVTETVVTSSAEAAVPPPPRLTPESRIPEAPAPEAATAASLASAEPRVMEAEVIEDETVETTEIKDDGSTSTTVVSTTRTVGKDPDSFYDFPGDDKDIQDLQGLGPTNARKLRGVGVHTTARLMFEDPARLAAVSGIAEAKVRRWQAMAELEKVNGIGPVYAYELAQAGITGVDELKKRSAETLATQVEDVGISAKRIQTWQEAAKAMRRSRQKVPQK